MKKSNVILIIFNLFICVLKSNTVDAKLSAITYVDTPGRLGDKLMVYSKAKWLSYKYKIPLFYVPLNGFDNFMMHKTDVFYKQSMCKNFKKVVCLERDCKKIVIEPNKSILYVVNYYSNIDVDWGDKVFLKELREKIHPVIPIKNKILPEDRVSIAVHVRKGGGFDWSILSDQGLEEWHDNFSIWSPTKEFYNKYCDCRHPFKFPPDKYYIDQIKKVYELLDRVSLHVHIFTDDKNPALIKQKYKEALINFDITFSSRNNGDEKYKNCVIEDLFSMTQFDCLIRSGSNFSFFADMLGDYIFVLYPEHMYWKKKDSKYRLIVDKVGVHTNITCKIKNFLIFLNEYEVY